MGFGRNGSLILLISISALFFLSHYPRRGLAVLEKGDSIDSNMEKLNRENRKIKIQLVMPKEGGSTSHNLSIDAKNAMKAAKDGDTVVVKL